MWGEQVLQSPKAETVKSIEYAAFLTDQARRMTDCVARFCNDLPFAGKLAISPAVLAVYRERNPVLHKAKLANASALLAGMVLGHSAQIMMGVGGAREQFEQLVQHPEKPEAWLWSAISLVYTAANCAATYAQLHALGRLQKEFSRTDERAVPYLKNWGINGEEIDHEVLIKTLLDANAAGRVEDIRFFLLALQPETRERVLELIQQAREFQDITVSETAIDACMKIGGGYAGFFKPFFDAIAVARRTYHDAYSGKSRIFSLREVMVMMSVTLSGQGLFLASQVGGT